MNDDHDRQFLSMERLWRAYCDLKADNERLQVADSILAKVAAKGWFSDVDEATDAEIGVFGFTADELDYLRAAAAVAIGRDGGET